MPTGTSFPGDWKLAKCRSVSGMVRPPDIVCRRIYILPVFLLLLLFSPPNLRDRWTKIGHMVGSKCNLKTHVRNLGYPSTYKSGAQKPHCGRLRNLTATLTAYIFGRKHGIDNQSSVLTTTRGLRHRLKMSWTLVHKRLQTRPPFYPPSVNSAFCFIARLRRRTSANGTQPNFAK